MKAQWENLLMSSISLYIDNLICKVGEGFVNHTGEFFSTQRKYNQFFTYSLPFKQIVSDVSISGANVLQGVYVNGYFKNVGESGLEGIMHHKGALLFSQDHGSNAVTGNFSVKEFNVYITTKAEEDLLFKTAPQVNPKIAQNETQGLDFNTETYPAIFLKNMGGYDMPLVMGTDGGNTVTNVRAIVLSDSAFSLDAVCGLLKKTSKRKIPIIENLPFNALGAFTGITYDYDALVSQSQKNAHIWNARVSKIMPQTGGVADLNLDVFAALVDFEIYALFGD
jgi:hypothetical protein